MGRASLLFPLLALIFLTASATTTTQAPPSGPRVGGWSPIKDVLDPEVQDVAKFAVSQHNKNAGTNLALVSVLSGESQVVAGMNYKLLIKASDGHTYEAVVFDQSWTKTRKLTSFTLKQPAVTATTKKPPTFAAKVGGWNPIKDVADPTVQDVAKFAVAEHNKASGTSLALVAVVSGETQVVSGMNYKLLIKASDGNTYEAVVYDQPWTNTRKLTSFTLKGSAATAKPGGWSPIKDVAAPQVQDIAKFAVAEHNKDAGTNLALVAVLSGETQVVSGMNYKLLIKASDGNTYEAVVYDQPWTNTRKLTSFTLKGSAATAKPGGWSPIKDVAAPQVQDIAKFAVAEHNKDAGTNLALVAVLSGETQVVSGMNYKLLIKASDGNTYEAVVYDQPWTNTRKLTSFTLKGSAATAKPGGWSPIKDVAAPQVQDIAKFAVAEHNKDAGTNLALVAVLSGETQVVSGTNYRLVIKASDGHTYLAVVYDQPWTNTRKLTSFTLKGSAATAKPVGWSPIKDVAAPQVQDIAKFAVAEHNKDAGTNLALVAVLSGETQVVSGTNYKLLIKASDGNTYEAVVYDQPWTNTRKLTSFTLKGSAATAKPVGWSPIKDVAAPQVQDIAKFAVAEHNKDAGTNLALVAVLSGETQVVSGMNYKLLIKASDGNTYEAVVYDQPWTNTRKLTSFTLKGSAATAKPGGWSPIKDVAAPQVQDIAKFAVAEHNKDAGTNLALVAVLSGETQVVAGLNYRLVIKASDGHTYLAVVWDKAGQKVRKLTSFTLKN